MKRIFGLLLIFSFSLLFSVNTTAEIELNGKYMTLQDYRGHIITQTGHRVVVGDEYLNSDNHLYRVVQIKNEIAVVKLVKQNGLQTSKRPGVQAYINEFFRFDFLRAEVKQRGPIAIYHTHSDESYVPSDGTSSKPAHGGVFQVGDALTKTLESKGIPVIHSKTPHDPHDGMAYDRSRRTAIQLLRDRPVCLLDVHRDAGPIQGYSEIIDKKPVTRVQLVVGRQNPNFQANNDFAKNIKTVVDRKYPGLVKGIFYGNGKYNQDLGPRAILLEFGTEKASKEAAERGASIFAAAASNVLYGTTGSGIINRGSLRSLFWIVVALIGAAGLFLLINRGNLKDIGKEFSGAAGGENVTDEKEEPNERE